MYCIDCKLLITNNLVALHFVQVHWVTNSLSLNSLRIFLNIFSISQRGLITRMVLRAKRGGPVARRPRLVLIHSNNSDLLRLLTQIFCVFVESKTVVFSYHYVIAVSQWITEIQTLFGRCSAVKWRERVK